MNIEITDDRIYITIKYANDTIYYHTKTLEYLSRNDLKHFFPRLLEYTQTGLTVEYTYELSKGYEYIDRENIDKYSPNDFVNKAFKVPLTDLLESDFEGKLLGTYIHHFNDNKMVVSEYHMLGKNKNSIVILPMYPVYYGDSDATILEFADNVRIESMQEYIPQDLKKVNYESLRYLLLLMGLKRLK